MKKFFLGSIFMLLVACAPANPRMDFTQGGVPPIIEPDSTSAVVYFMRAECSMCFHQYIVQEHNKEIGILQGDTYFMHKLPAGKYNFWIQTAQNVLVQIRTLTVEAGKTYYLYYVPSMLFGGSHGFKEISAEQAAPLLTKFTYLRLFTEEEKLQFDIATGKKPPQ